MSSLSTMFRMNAYPFIWVSDNGFLQSQDQSSGTWHPSYIVSGTGVLMGKNNYGGGGTKRTVSNSELVGNITAWAIMRRQ
jgi:CBS domain-containing protein